MRHISIELESLVNLHVAALEVSFRRDSEFLLDFGLVEIRLDPRHLSVAERTVLSISIALLSNVVGVSTGGLDRSGDSPAGESSGDAAEAVRSACEHQQRVSTKRKD